MVEEGAIEKLLNDKQSYEDLPIPPDRNTASLLNSVRLYSKLLDAFDGMDGGDPKARQQPSKHTCKSDLVDEISLFAPTTDIEGVPLPLQLSNSMVYERRYRNVFRFRYTSCDVSGNPRNDFQPDYNPFLAYAARCTSSFPFAFQPMRLCEIDNALEHNSIYKNRLEYCGSASKEWQPFFRQYLAPSDVVTTPFSKRSFGDGGYLETSLSATPSTPCWNLNATCRWNANSFMWSPVRHILNWSLPARRHPTPFRTASQR